MSSSSEFGRNLAGELSRRQLLRGIGLGGVAITLPGLLAACSGEGSTGAAVTTARFSISEPPRGLDIARAYDSASIFVTTVGVEPLLDYDSSLTLQPVLAKSWRQPDATTYVYTIRPGVTFWDGSKLTADDVVASMRRHAKGTSELNSYFADVESIEQTGDLEVTIELERPNVFFRYVAALVGILPKAFLDEHGREVGTPQVRTMGTGPYEIAEYEPDKSITWKRRDGYWGKRPDVESVVISVIGEETTAELAFESEELDSVAIPLSRVGRYEQMDGVKVSSIPDLTTSYLAFDQDTPPWDDVHVRRAFAHSFDGAALNKSVFDGRWEVATSLVPPQQWGSIVSAEEARKLYAGLPSYEFDVAKAKAELAKSSMPDGFSVSVDVASDEASTMGKVMLNMREVLRGVGIELKVNEVTAEKHSADRFAHKKLGLRVETIGADYPDPANFLTLMLDSRAATENAYNTANYRDKAMDALLREQAAADGAARKKPITEILRKAAKELPYLPMFWQTEHTAVRDSIRVDEYALAVFRSVGKRIDVP